MAEINTGDNILKLLQSMGKQRAAIRAMRVELKEMRKDMKETRENANKEHSQISRRVVKLEKIAMALWLPALGGLASHVTDFHLFNSHPQAQAQGK